MRVRVCLPENLCNQSPGLGALVIREETPSTLPVGCPTEGLSDITRQYLAMLLLGYHLILLLSSVCGTSLPVSPLCLSFSYQACMETPLPEFHLPGDPLQDLLGPKETQCLCEDDVGKDEGPLGVPGPPDYPLPFRSQYYCEAAPYCSRGRGVPARRLCG